MSDVSFQPLNDYMVSASTDSTWSFHNVQQGVSLAKFQEDAAVTQIEFHPDGLVLAVGLKTGAIKVYDIRDQKVAMEFQGPQATDVKKLIFSNKGTYLAASWKDQDVCRVYSLHKQCQFIDIAHAGISVSDIAFDYYGGYLATAAANQVSFFQYRTWPKPQGVIRPFEPNHAVSARFSASGKHVYASSDLYGTLKVFKLHN